MKNYIDKPGILNGYIDNILLKMRLTTVIFMVSMLQVSASTGAKEFNYFKKGASLIQIFKEIKKQTGYSIMLNEMKIDVTATIDADFKKATIHDVLNKCLSNLSLSYSINDKTVMIKGAEPSFRKKLVDFLSFIDVKGRVVDEKNQPLVGATVKVKNSSRSTVTDDKGFFVLTNIEEKSILIISFLGYESIEIPASEEVGFIKLISNESKLNEVEIVSTGYQEILKERVTGSFSTIDNKLLNRVVSQDLLSRLKGVTNGLLIDRTNNTASNQNGLSVRGRSTIFSNTSPLIVVDNFPFAGDINNLNPDMIENITVLKDAAAASIWGAFSGNGVIVITTKKGKLNQAAAITIKADLTVGAKPDLYYQPQMSSTEFIDVEQFLFDKGAYNSIINNGYDAISPVVAILQKIKLDPTYSAQGMADINALRNVDNRKEQNTYLFRSRIQQRYFADVNGGGANQTYYFSGGYDKDLSNSVALSNSRITLKGNNVYSLLNKRLRLNTDINFSKSKSINSNSGINYFAYTPYESLADENGNALGTLRRGGLRTSYTDTAGNGRLLDWTYRPLDELREKYTTSSTNLTDYRLNLGLSYKIINGLTLSLNYQYYSASNKLEDSYNKDSFYARDLINTYSQINEVTGIVTRPIPIGDIYSQSFITQDSDYGRAQLDFNKIISGKHLLNAIAGYEIRDDRAKINTMTLYGYSPETATYIVIDPISLFKNYYNDNSNTIGQAPKQFGSTNRYISLYGNLSYTYDEKYIISGSYRKDKSNLFGVNANQKGVPLWSTGVAWNIHKENLWSVDWLSSLQLKASYGYNGVVNNSISAYLTAAPSFNNQFNKLQYYAIVNPPNDNLRWERVKNINGGLYFSIKNDRLSGSIEYFIKHGLDLIASSPIAPQTGVSIFTGNSADTRANGIDVQLNSKNLEGKFKWLTTYIFNYAKDKITGYKVTAGNNNSIVTANQLSLSPLVDFPINSIFAYKWGGLDVEGNPQGYLNGVISADYTKIRNSRDQNELKFFGSATPTIFGSIRNTFSFKGLELSFNIIYKMNYYFRRSSLSNSNLYGGNFMVSDYTNRWQKAGDEAITTVPSLIYPANGLRDSFYLNSEVLVERGDHIRLQDIQINFTLNKSQFKKMPFSTVNFYVYSNNMGLLWKANKQGLDPDLAGTGFPNPKTIAFGMKTNF